MVHHNCEIDVAVENLNLRSYVADYEVDDDENEDGKCHN